MPAILSMVFRHLQHVYFLFARDWLKTMESLVVMEAPALAITAREKSRGWLSAAASDRCHLEIVGAH
jgi:hypothetical protein